MTDLCVVLQCLIESMISECENSALQNLRVSVTNMGSLMWSEQQGRDFLCIEAFQQYGEMQLKAATVMSSASSLGRRQAYVTMQSLSILLSMC